MARTFDIQSTGSCLHVCLGVLLLLFFLGGGQVLGFFRKTALVTAIVLFYDMAMKFSFFIPSTGSCLHVCFLWFLRKTALVTAIVVFLLWL